MTTVIDIAVGSIKPSPSNPARRSATSTRLAESIIASGVLQPLTVRPDPNLVNEYELVLGERRWRASKIAKQATVPAIVREMSDTEVLEAQLVENVQRTDVHPLEEAQGYQALLDHHGYTIETLATKTGRSRAHLYGRLKLTKLAPAVRKAFLDDRIPASIAELLARLPVPKLQEQALHDILGGAHDYTTVDELDAIGIRPEGLHDVNGRVTDNSAVHPLLSFRAAQALIHRRYSTRLDMAKFEVADASLYPEAGACTTCPHRSGFRDEAQPTLFPDLERADDVCTNPPCFEKKTAAVWQRARLEAKDRGLEVIDGDDAKEVFGYDGKTSTRAKYVDPAQDLPYELQRSPGKPATWAKTLGKKLAEVPTVLVQDPSGAPRELLDRAKAMEVLVAAGKIDKPVKPRLRGRGQEAEGLEGPTGERQGEPRDPRPRPQDDGDRRDRRRRQTRRQARARVVALGRRVAARARRPGAQRGQCGLHRPGQEEALGQAAPRAREHRVEAAAARDRPRVR